MNHPARRTAASGPGRQAPAGVAVLLLLLVLFAHATAQPPAANEPAAGALRPGREPAYDVNAEANAALAERLSEFARQALRQDVVTRATWDQAVALHRATVRLDPREPRYWRLLAEAELAVGNRDEAIAALNSYRAARGRSDDAATEDQFAQAQLIELYLDGQEGLQKKLDYLKTVLTRETISPEVRSHAATLAARLLLERSEREAAEMAAQALQLNPINPTAARMHYDLVARKGTPPQRLAGLLAMLRANPVQPQAIEEVARTLVAGGLHEPALEWFRQALDIYNEAGVPDVAAFQAFVLDYAAELTVAGRNADAAKLLSELMKADPTQPSAWFLRLLMSRGGDAGEWSRTLEGARAALTERWNRVAQAAANGGQAPAGQQPAAPAPPPAGDPAAVAQQVKQLNNPQLAAAAVSAATDLSWFELYFANQPAAGQKWASAAAALLPADADVVRVLNGWASLLDNQADAARAALSPAAERHPLAALGLARLAAGAGGNANAEAGRLAAQAWASHPTGWIGALLWQEMQSRGAKPAIPPDVAAGLQGELQKFPRGWLEIVRDPLRFYQVRVEPLGGRVAARYREPMLVRVSLQNVGEQDLSIGEGGVIRPDLWFDAEALGPQPRSFPLGVAFDRIAGPLRLRPGQATSQIVRIDQGKLAEFLTENATPQYQVSVAVVTNPVPRGDTFVPAPAGRRAAMPRRFVRIGFAITTDSARQRAYEEAATGLPASRMRYMELLTVYVPDGRNAGGPAAAGEAPPAGAGNENKAPPPRATPPDYLKAVQEIAARYDQIMNDGRDRAPAAVAAWATFLQAAYGAPDRQRPDLIRAMALDARWEARLLAAVALAMTDSMPAEQRKDVAAHLASQDADPVVKLYASAVLELLVRPPATRPAATQPATGGPATVPAQ